MQTDWGQCNIINRIKILGKRGSDKIHDVISTKYQKYPSNTKLNMLMFMAKVNKLPQGSLINIPSNDAYSIPIHLRTMTLADISKEQRE